ncbi:MAG TPA: hypothetical protein DCL43_07665 [Chitinophagaceae bacterium]|nr:hypothetical protein [Chitinophagaceae bacterium]HAN39534.1 hypothetical protein [Chitinophagaceae bacterium]
MQQQFTLYRTLLRWSYWFIAVWYSLCVIAWYLTVNGKAWLSIVSLTYPVALIALIVVTIAATFTARYTIFISSLLVLFSYRMIDSSFPLNGKAQVAAAPNNNHIRIATFNVQHFGDSRFKHDSANSQRNIIFRTIKQWNIDVVCLQDFVEFKMEGERSNINDMLQRAGFKYHFFSNDFAYDIYTGTRFYGTAIFSKYPIVDSAQYPILNGSYAEHMSAVSVVVKQQKLKIYNMHLQSYYLGANKDTSSKAWVDASTAYIANHGSRMDKIVYFDSVHHQQVKKIKIILNRETQPYILACDANAIPAMHTYQQLASNLNDAWANCGFGWGATYKNRIPYMRIDYLFGSNAIQWQAVQVVDHAGSDHRALIADFTLRK